jgi:hypothetical protein
LCIAQVSRKRLYQFVDNPVQANSSEARCIEVGDHAACLRVQLRASSFSAEAVGFWILLRMSTRPVAARLAVMPFSVRAEQGSGKVGTGALVETQARTEGDHALHVLLNMSIVMLPDFMDSISADI